METTFKGNDPHRTLMAYVDQMDGRLSDRTKREYTTRLKEISKNLCHTGDSVTPDMLVEHVRNLVVSGQIASSTYRSYKSSITFWLGQQTQAVIAGDGKPHGTAFELGVEKPSRVSNHGSRKPTTVGCADRVAFVR